MAFDFWARWKNHAESLLGSANYHAAVTTHDTNELDPTPRALRVGTAGTVVVSDAAGTDVTYTCVAGEVLMVRARKVKTASTATGIVAWW